MKILIQAMVENEQSGIDYLFIGYIGEHSKYDNNNLEKERKHARVFKTKEEALPIMNLWSDNGRIASLSH